MALMNKCDRCDRMEFYWWPAHEPIDDEWRPYICTKCIDQKKEVTRIGWFVALHRMRFPPEVFDFIYPENHRQCTFLDQCQRARRVDNLRYFLNGAPYTQNAIHNFPLQLEKHKQFTAKVFTHFQRPTSSGFTSIGTCATSGCTTFDIY